MILKRLIVVCVDTLALEGLRRIFEPSFDVVVAEEQQLLEYLAKEMPPDAVLLDVPAGTVNYFEMARLLRKTAPETKLIILSDDPHAECVCDALRAGASGYLLRQSEISEVKEAVVRVLAGTTYICSLVDSVEVNRLMSEAPNTSSGDLSAREREVLQLTAEGLPGKEIAHQLGISPRTVEYHRRRVGKKLGLSTTAELTRYAVRHGLVKA